ncbi:unnamed protein product [Candida verbasci]|uniref:BED-type domain-containing protein n=1 Tax=Candida verbasci TaxID=1227364 RepID=A0A9W4TTB1_9ASCO|nr:unnamed protein product [Candida verbasci]
MFSTKRNARFTHPLFVDSITVPITISASIEEFLFTSEEAAESETNSNEYQDEPIISDQIEVLDESQHDTLYSKPETLLTAELETSYQDIFKLLDILDSLISLNLINRSTSLLEISDPAEEALELLDTSSSSYSESISNYSDFLNIYNSNSKTSSSALLTQPKQPKSRQFSSLESRNAEYSLPAEKIYHLQSLKSKITPKKKSLKLKNVSIKQVNKSTWLQKWDKAKEVRNNDMKFKAKNHSTNELMYNIDHSPKEPNLQSTTQDQQRIINAQQSQIRNLNEATGSASTNQFETSTSTSQGSSINNALTQLQQLSRKAPPRQFQYQQLSTSNRIYGTSHLIPQQQTQQQQQQQQPEKVNKKPPRKNKPGKKFGAKKRSWVWAWFSQDHQDHKIAACDYCGKVIIRLVSDKGSPKKLSEHLKTHKITKETVNYSRNIPINGLGITYTNSGDSINQQQQDTKKSKSPTFINNEVLPSNNMFEVNNRRYLSTKFDNTLYSSGKFHKHLIEFLMENQLPISVIKSKSFQQLIYDLRTDSISDLHELTNLYNSLIEVSRFGSNETNKTNSTVNALARVLEKR